jgi:hypothetical protein
MDDDILEVQESPEQRFNQRFGWHEGEGNFSQCSYCIHKHTKPAIAWNEVQSVVNTCNAFPERIPDVILYNHFDHRQHFPGDGGVKFAPFPNAEPAPTPKPMQR